MTDRPPATVTYLVGGTRASGVLSVLSSVIDTVQLGDVECEVAGASTLFANVRRRCGIVPVLLFILGPTR